MTRIKYFIICLSFLCIGLSQQGDFDLVDLRAARLRAGHENPPLIWGVGVMDVSGHGPGAAVEVAMVDAILRTYQGEKDGGIVSKTQCGFENARDVARRKRRMNITKRVGADSPLRCAKPVNHSQ